MTSPPNVNSTPGWHDDPEDSTSLRYWDGSQWTDQRVPKPAKSITSQALAWLTVDFGSWTVAHYMLFGTLFVVALAAFCIVFISVN